MMGSSSSSAIKIMASVSKDSVLIKWRNGALVIQEGLHQVYSGLRMQTNPHRVVHKIAEIVFSCE